MLIILQRSIFNVYLTYVIARIWFQNDRVKKLISTKTSKPPIVIIVAFSKVYINHKNVICSKIHLGDYGWNFGRVD